MNKLSIDICQCNSPSTFKLDFLLSAILCDIGSRWTLAVLLQKCAVSSHVILQWILNTLLYSLNCCPERSRRFNEHTFDFETAHDIPTIRHRLSELILLFVRVRISHCFRKWLPGMSNLTISDVHTCLRSAPGWVEHFAKLNGWMRSKNCTRVDEECWQVGTQVVCRTQSESKFTSFVKLQSDFKDECFYSGWKSVRTNWISQ